MPVTAEQAKAELRRRQALAELRRRGVISPETPQIAPGAKIDPNIPRMATQQPAGGLAQRGITPTGIRSIPVPPEEQATDEKSEWLRQQIAEGKIEPVPPTFWQKTKQALPEIIGGTVGGIAGAATFGPDPTDLVTVPAAYKSAAKFAGGVLGAGVGGAAGTGLKQTYRMTRPGARSMTLSEIYMEQLIAGMEQAAYELVGRGVAKVGGKILAPVKKRMIKGATGLSKKLTQAGKRIGIKAHLTPAQATESRIIDTIEGMAEKSFLGGGKLQRLKTITQPQAFAQYVDDVVKQISKGTRTQLTPDEAGTLLLDTLTGKKLAFKATAKAAYNKVDRLAGGSKVSLVPLKDFARKTLKTAAARKGIGSTQAGDALLKKVLKLDDVISFRQAQALRSALLDEKAAMSLTRDKAVGLARQFIQFTDGSMEKGAKGLSPEAYKAWRGANKFYREGMERFNKKIVRSLMKNLAENPEIAAKKIFRPGATEQIKAIRKVVDEKTWRTLKSAYLEQMLVKNADVDKIVLGKSFANQIHKLEETGTLRAIFNGQEAQAIKSIGELGKLLQAPTGGSGGMIIQLMQAGAVVNLGRMAVGGAPRMGAESATIVIGPPVLSRMLANPKWAKWLRQGFRVPRGTPAAIALATRIAKTAYNIEREMIEEKRKLTQAQELPPLRERLSLPAAGKELFKGVFGEERLGEMRY